MDRGTGHRAEEFKIRGNLPVCVRNMRRGWSLVPSTSFSTCSRSGSLESFIELFLKTTARGQADGRSGSEGVLCWPTFVLSCSFRWGPPCQPLLCQCISARGSVREHRGDAGALPGRGHPSCVSQMVPGDGRGDLRCPRDPPRPPQRHSPDLPLPSFEL